MDPYLPSPDEIEIQKAGILWGTIIVPGDNRGRPRKQAQRPQGGTRADNDAWERAWRAAMARQQEESEVGDE